MNFKSLSWGAVALLAMGLPASAALAGTVVVTIDGVRSSQGMILAQLCDSAVGYPDAPCRRMEAVPAIEGRVTLVFTGVPDGTYAFEAFQDEDSNFLFDLASEGYAFSNDAPPPKTFDDAAFTVVGAARQNVRMTYKSAE